jgi:hypothetical protein
LFCGKSKITNAQESQYFEGLGERWQLAARMRERFFLLFFSAVLYQLSNLATVLKGKKIRHGRSADKPGCDPQLSPANSRAWPT